MGEVVFSRSEDECHCSSCLNNQLLIDDQRKKYDNWDSKEPFSDEQYIICPPRVLGYHLESRTWLELDVKKLKIITQLVSDGAFKKLQLQKGLKDIIQRLVQSHTSGRGLVILLHGPPGVGKTLTAESVASMAGKPLFALSTSDIGLDPADVEHNLESLFELAARWRAVLLFDEADSRVNLGIKYTNLSMTQKKEIFTQFINEAPKDQIDDKEEIYEWFKEDVDATEWLEPLNGRQVRNVLFSAASLALEDGGVLKLEHVKIMAKHTAKFQGDLKAVVQLARSKAEAGQPGD
ncbi:P-loop containing nucleoside triphosphate hydrolase protein [Massariosphaeria phaeospora]|uniref:P-loop containing nucleoside triphosphate hydrolase protein n=1 Tax=Massariosphaeria phaeospora TaxID=100035 RepID=A0A7C8M5Q5_9PLEO|nr:P-loop containing nucleoside triphosphate hydrolase protein [Massariosphaeria phaeospora]